MSYTSLGVIRECAKGKEYKPSQERIDQLMQYWNDGKLGTIAPDQLRDYVEDAITVEQISIAWKIPKEVIVKMYERAEILPLKGD